MTYDKRLAGRVREGLANTSQVTEKKMFGGVAFMVNGKMCVTVGRGGIMVRIDPAIQNELMRIKGSKPVIMKGRAYRGYIRVEEQALRTDDKLKSWIGYALDFNGCIATGPKNSGSAKP